MASASDVLQAIEEAFRDATYPGDDRLVTDSSTANIEADRIKTAFAGVHWRDVPNETLQRNRSALAFLSPEGYAFYLPAFMRFSVTDFEHADVIPGEIAFTLTPPQGADLDALEAAAEANAGLQPLNNEVWTRVMDALRGGYAEEIFQNFFTQRLAQFDERQKRAIRLFLEFLRDEYGEDFPSGGPELALKRYWGRSTDA